jgi:hypothetical protein
MWDLWLWDRFLSEFFSFPLLISFHWCSILISFGRCNLRMRLALVTGDVLSAVVNTAVNLKVSQGQGIF